MRFRREKEIAILMNLEKRSKEEYKIVNFRNDDMGFRE